MLQKYFIFFYLFIIITNNFSSEISIFSYQEYQITSFPNIEINNKKERYVISSYQQYLYFDFPVELSPFSKIAVYGTKQYNSSYINVPQNIVWYHSLFPILNKFSVFRIDITREIINLYPKSGALITALILGNKSFLDDEFMEYIRFSGLAHLLALSGLHLIIFIMFFIWLFSLLGMSNRFLGVSTLPFSLFYLFLGGLGISLQRAVLFHFLSSFFSYIRIPVLNTKIFFIALFVNMIISPNNIYSLSFWLSYISVAGIVFSYKFWYDVLSKYIIPVINSYLAVSLAAFMSVSPILILVFGVLNIYSVFSSTIIVPFMPILLIFCFSAVFFSYYGISFEMLDQIIFLFYRFIYLIAKIFSEIPMGVMFFQNKMIASVVFILIMIIMVTILNKKRICDVG
ncbi:MAG: ComEC/Rec2 family competence protein [Spirochaetota bacterium]|nr:ComEC/Rec2 family competence protein [Spirochaetota bacterium]